MKTNLLKLFLSAALLTIGAQVFVYGQQVTIKAFSLHASTTLEDIKNLKAANPKITVDELVKSSNALLQKQGLNFSFALDADLCQKVLELGKKQKNPNSPVTLNAKLNSFEGEATGVVLPPIKFGKDASGKCSSLLSLLEITPTDFVTFIENRTVKFYKPQNFNFNQVNLVENKTYRTNIRTWRVPFCTTPLSVSADGKLLFLSLPGENLSEMVLILYDDGTMQFYPKKDIDSSEKGVNLDNLPKTLNLPDSSFIGFGSGEKQRVLKYSNVCE